MSEESLDVYLYDKRAGVLLRDASGPLEARLAFRYDAEYLQSDNAAPLSAALPLQADAFDHAASHAFFSGLLPEGPVRMRLARYLHISDGNIFALLKEIGGECAGAVSVYPDGITPESSDAQDYRILSDDEAHDILSNLDKRPMLAGADDIRISGAGAQDKLIVALVDGRIAIPRKNTPSTHIIKPAIKGLDHSVQNEFFCMTLAARVGLKVPKVMLHELEGEIYYLIERYDRIIEADGAIRRLHQEDFCQALKIPPELKYQNEGGPGLDECFDLVRSRSNQAARDSIALLQAVIFNVLIGNGDAHGKNFSLLYSAGSGSVMLAPFYDLLCTVAYNNAYKSKMAMRLGKEYRFANLSRRNFEQLAEQLGFRADFVLKTLRNMIENIGRTAPLLANELNGDPKTASPVYAQIMEEMADIQLRFA